MDFFIFAIRIVSMHIFIAHFSFTIAKKHEFAQKLKLWAKGCEKYVFSLIA